MICNRPRGLWGQPDFEAASWLAVDDQRVFPARPPAVRVRLTSSSACCDGRLRAPRVPLLLTQIGTHCWREVDSNFPFRVRCKRGLRRKSPASAACRRRSPAAAVGGHQLRRKAKSRNRTLFARGTRSSNPSPSSGESVSRTGRAAVGRDRSHTDSVTTLAEAQDRCLHWTIRARADGTRRSRNSSSSMLCGRPRDFGRSQTTPG